MNTDTPAATGFWDQQYAVDGYKYGTVANAWLSSRGRHLPPQGRVLVPGDGEGRNGVWLARQGLQVLSVDASHVGLDKARQLAAQQGVDLQTLQVDLFEWTPEPASFDAVVLTYVHLPAAMRQLMHRRMAHALRPGGVLLLECFHPSQLGRGSGGPRHADLLAALADVREDFAGLLHEELAYEAEVLLDEGPGHQGLARVTRYQGRRTMQAAFSLSSTSPEPLENP